MDLLSTTTMLWHDLGWPLCRLVFYISIGLLVGNFIEAMNWTHGVARLAAPLVRLGHLTDTTGASFSMALFSGVSANTMLAEAYSQERIDKKELILANLFNSLPTYFLHLPTVFFITAPLIKGAAVIYVGLTFGAAMLRTIFILLVGRLFFAAPGQVDVTAKLGAVKRGDWRTAWEKTIKRFKKRLRKILVFTVPIYTLIFLFNKVGLFTWLERQLTDHVALLAWLDPQALGIVVFHVAAEFTAGLAAAGALLDGGTLGQREIILALMVGNILSSPVRAIRHQLPYYAGIFNPRLAVELVLYSQSFRMGSIMIMTFVYYLATL